MRYEYSKLHYETPLIFLAIKKRCRDSNPYILMKLRHTDWVASFLYTRMNREPPQRLERNAEETRQCVPMHPFMLGGRGHTEVSLTHAINE